MLGMNCIAGGVDRACQDLVTLVGRIQAKSPDTAILIQSVTPMTADSPRADDALNNTTIQTFNQQMQTLCQEKDGTLSTWPRPSPMRVASSAAISAGTRPWAFT